jgi:hypothetical protein
MAVFVHRASLSAVMWLLMVMRCQEGREAMVKSGLGQSSTLIFPGTPRLLHTATQSAESMQVTLNLSEGQGPLNFGNQAPVSQITVPPAEY